MPRVGFEPTISAGERPKTHALDRAATGTGTISVALFIYGLKTYARRLEDAERDAINFRLPAAHVYKYRNADGQRRQR